MMRKLFAAFLLLALAAPAASGQTSRDVIPDGWYPALHPSIQSALAQLKTAKSSKEMSELSRQIAEMTDAQLFIAYIRLYENLGTKDRAALRLEQTKWLKERSEAGAKAVESEGRPLGNFEQNTAELALTEERLAELRARYTKATAKK